MPDLQAKLLRQRQSVLQRLQGHEDPGVPRIDSQKWQNRAERSGRSIWGELSELQKMMLCRSGFFKLDDNDVMVKGVLVGGNEAFLGG